MSKGQIIEQGTHDELLKHDDEYARLVKIQDLTTSQSEDSTGVDSDAEDASPELIREKSKLSRLPTKEESGDIEALPVRDDYQQHKQVGLTSAGAHVIKDTMIIKWWYFLMIVGCLAAGKFPALPCLG